MTTCNEETQSRSNERGARVRVCSCDVGYKKQLADAVLSSFIQYSLCHPQPKTIFLNTSCHPKSKKLQLRPPSLNPRNPGIRLMIMNTGVFLDLQKREWARAARWKACADLGALTFLIQILEGVLSEGEPNIVGLGEKRDSSLLASCAARPTPPPRPAVPPATSHKNFLLRETKA